MLLALFLSSKWMTRVYQNGWRVWNYHHWLLSFQCFRYIFFLLSSPPPATAKVHESGPSGGEGGGEVRDCRVNGEGEKKRAVHWRTHIWLMNQFRWQIQQKHHQHNNKQGRRKEIHYAHTGKYNQSRWNEQSFLFFLLILSLFCE